MLERKRKEQKMFAGTSVHVEVVHMHICARKSVNKGLSPPEGHTLRAKHPFVIAEESRASERATEARRRQRRREKRVR